MYTFNVDLMLDGIVVTLSFDDTPVSCWELGYRGGLLDIDRVRDGLLIGELIAQVVSNNDPHDFEESLTKQIEGQGWVLMLPHESNGQVL